MRIGASKNRRGRRRLILNMASMIDCTFLLLAYFLLTMVVLDPEDQLSSNLKMDRTSSSGLASDFQPQIVDVRMVDSTPSYLLGDRVFTDRDSLTQALGMLETESDLFIRVHDGPTVGFAAAAMQAGQDAGFSSVTYVPSESE
ncbi:MAG: hypothetical protein CMJ33_05570 [Phycisphaerae bacterium]|nr:hypothetical protein [Phycisphaerae bacterium]